MSGNFSDWKPYNNWAETTEAPNRNMGESITQTANPMAEVKLLSFSNHRKFKREEDGSLTPADDTQSTLTLLVKGKTVKMHVENSDLLALICIMADKDAVEMQLELERIRFPKEKP